MYSMDAPGFRGKELGRIYLVFASSTNESVLGFGIIIVLTFPGAMTAWPLLNKTPSSLLLHQSSLYITSFALVQDAFDLLPHSVYIGEARYIWQFILDVLS
ncbi:hypothetical protein ACN47E_001584 [Coniothyrium glycines]